MTKLLAGTSVLAGHSKSMELAVQFVRAFRSLDAVVGGDAKTAKAWPTSKRFAGSATLACGYVTLSDRAFSHDVYW